MWVITNILTQRVSIPLHIMKKGIHPKYKKVKVVLSDGSKILTRITMDVKDGVYHSEIYSKNHPFYTKNQNLTKKADRIDRFTKRYKK
jgi:ribosomal protein L31